MLKKMRDFIVNPFYVKIFFVITSFLLVTSVGRPYVDGVIKIGIVWSAIVFFYDLFTQRRVLKSRGMVLLVGFLAVFGLTIVINYQVEFKNNFSFWAYAVCMLLVLYPYQGIGREQALREMSVLNYVYLGLTCVTTTLSFLLFLEQYTYWGDYFGFKFCIGIYDNRLFGVHLNPGIVLTSIGICLCVLQFFINRKLKKKHIGVHIFLGYAFVMNFICMALENSKGAFIGMAAFTGLLCAFGAGRLLRDKKLLVKCAAGFCVLVVSAGLFWGGISLARSGLAYLPPLVMDQPIVKQVRESNTKFFTKHGFGTEEWNDPVENDPSDPSHHGTKVDMDRTEIPEDYGMLTGRPIIWKFGLREFAKRPLLGYGPNYHTHVQVLERPLAHFHNLIVQCLVSVGLIGSFFILFFLALQLFYLIMKVFKKNRDMVYGAIFSMLLMLAINSMAEVTILFMVRTTAFVFWIYLGYLMVLSEEEQEKTSWIDKPFLALDRWLTQKQEIIKNRRAASHGKK